MTFDNGVIECQSNLSWSIPELYKMVGHDTFVNCFLIKFLTEFFYIDFLNPEVMS